MVKRIVTMVIIAILLVGLAITETILVRNYMVNIQNEINNLVALYNTTYDVLKEEIKTYNEDNYASSLVVETNTVETVKDSAISALIIILVDVVVIAIIMIVIVAVEKKKEGKKENIQEKVKE